VFKRIDVVERLLVFKLLDSNSQPSETGRRSFILRLHPS
jgi:hypothetical protein